MTVAMNNSLFFVEKFGDTRNMDLPLQFVLSETPVRKIRDFICVQFNGLYISKHFKLNEIGVFDHLGGKLGLFLGFPVDIESESVVESDIYITDPLEWGDVPHFLEQFAGSYIFIYNAGLKNQVFLDANGTMSFVYDPVLKVAGSTAAAILHEQEYFIRFRSNLFNKLDVLNIGWFPSGITAHEGVERLLCNHYLDLDTWKSVRFWPVDKMKYSDNPVLEITSIREETIGVMNALCKKSNVKQSLTAGYETRFLLACARHLMGKISFFTVASSKIDVDVARKLSIDFDIELQEMPVIKATGSQQKEWLYRAGHAVGGSNLVNHPSIQQFHHDTILSVGLGGEVGRGFFWKKNDNIDDDVTAELILGRIGMPSDELIIKRTIEWLGGLPDGLDFFTILDLAYLELRMSPWAFAQSYAQDAICAHVSPLITYRNYKSMFKIHPNEKKNGYVLKRAILDSWPELLKYPINRYGDWRDIFAVVAKLSDPKRVISKLRKSISR
jgi:hypothetical protein